MHVDKVKYTAHFENGRIQSQWIGVDVALHDSDDPDKAFQLAKEMTEDFHKRANPHLDGTTITDSHAIPVIQQDSGPINSQQEQDELETAIHMVEQIEYQEDAITWMNNNGWTFNVELKKIANSKPKRP